MESIMNFDIKNVLVNSITDVFDMMLSMEIQISEDTQPIESNGNLILGSINFMGDVVGIVNIQVSEAFSKEMVGSMLDMDPDEIEGPEEIQDVVGELCNMVGGTLKSALCDAGMECELSTPAIIAGSDYNHEARHMARYEYFSFYHGENLIAVDVGIKTGNEESQVQSPIEDASEKLKSFDVFDYDMQSSVDNSVAEVFDTMLSMNVSPFHSQNGTGLENDRIVGSISLSGEVLGRVNLHIPLSLSYDMTASLLGTPSEEIEDLDEVKDVVGEICNMVSGALKSDLCDAGMECRVSPPSFTTGKDFEMECLQLLRHERFLFTHQNEIFMVEVGIKPSDAK